LEGPSQGLLSREIDLAPLWRVMRALRDHPAQVVIGLGVFLRVWVYLSNRSYWMDESNLLGNMRGTPILDFSTPLRGDQLAPIGFIVLERMIVSLFGESGYSTRLLPLVCGVASLWLFQRLAFRWLSGSAAMVALIFFTFSDDLVYYSSELKPYSCDLAFALAIMLAATDIVDSPLCKRRIASLGILAVSSPWFSFPSVFIVAASGVTLLIDRFARKLWRELISIALVGLCWSASFILAYRAHSALLGDPVKMNVFWNFAFLYLTADPRADLVRFGGVFLEFFVNPLNLVPSWLPPQVVAFPVFLLFVGGVSLGRRKPIFFLMLGLPIALALIAAAAKKYPFHGRLILALFPAFAFMIAEATDRLRDVLGRRVWTVVLILLLFCPCWSTIYEATGSRIREFNSHGDLHRNRFME
jgi:hypothetical protein